MSKKIRFIGDIHGKYLPYLTLIEDVENSIQIGDFGLGFGSRGEPSYVDSLFKDYPGDHRYIRGNHDSPSHCKQSTRWIPDGTVEGNIMFIGGAASIDQAWRTEGKDWWADEELSIHRLHDMLNLYEMIKPEILVTHDCPEFLANEVMIPLVNGIKNFPSRTRDALDAMHHVHKPKIHLFGHWHYPLDIDYNGTRFICIPELSYIDLEV